MAVRVNRRYLTGYRRGAQVAAIDPFGFAQGSSQSPWVRYKSVR